MIATSLIATALVTGLATAQPTAKEPQVATSAAQEKGWIKAPKKSLREIFKPEYKRDLGDFELLKVNEEEWTRPLVSSDGSRLYVGTRSGRLLCLESTKGELLWQRRDMGTIGASFAESRNLLLTGSDSDFVALDRATGQTKWKLDLNGRIGGRITLQGRTAVLPVRPNAFVAVNLDTGKEQWRVLRQTPDSITVRGQAPPTVSPDGKTAYLGFSDGALMAVNMSDGGTQWIAQIGDRREFFADIDAAPIVLDGGKSLLAASYNAGLVRLEAQSSSVEFKKDDLIRLTGLVDVGQGLVVAAYGDGQVLGIGTRKGTVRWRYRLGRGAPTTPINLDDGHVLIGSTDGALAILQARTGRPVQIINLSSGVSLSPYYRAPHLAAMTNSGLLLVFRRGS